MFFKKKIETDEQRIERFLGKFGVRVYVDYWNFGLLMSDSSMILIATIKSITEDGAWLTVEMMTDDWVTFKPKAGTKFISSYTDRTTAVINTHHIMGIFETADT